MKICLHSIEVHEEAHQDEDVTPPDSPVAEIAPQEAAIPDKEEISVSTVSQEPPKTEVSPSPSAELMKTSNHRRLGASVPRQVPSVQLI